MTVQDIANPILIEIIPVDRGWILEKMALSIKRVADMYPNQYKVVILDKPTDSADLVFFLPESAFVQQRNSITVTYLAHKEDDPAAAKLFDDVARMSDCCITSSDKYVHELYKTGAKLVHKVTLGVDTELFTPKLVIGVVGRTYHTGRKGESILASVFDMEMIDFRFTGEGWPYPSTYYNEEELSNFYNQIDYLLIPSLIEGGPVPLLEALSSGCEVIAPSEIGFVNEFPHIPYQLGDGMDLRRVLNELCAKKRSLRNCVLDHDWTDFAKEHLKIFADLAAESVSSNANKEIIYSDDSQKLNILLVTHGSESAAKGGPSTRVEFIKKRLQDLGHSVVSKHNLNCNDDLENVDIVHIFNAWHPQSALNTIKIAKIAGKKVILSPIALNLEDWPIYRQLFEYIFKNYKSLDDIGHLIKMLPLLKKDIGEISRSKNKHLEGIEGHLEGLRQCCELVDGVIFLSKFEQQYINKISADIKLSALVCNGVSDKFNQLSDRTLFYEKYGLKDYVLCIGRIEYRKNQAMLAYALRDDAIPLVLIGDEGDDGYLDYVRRCGGQNLYHINRIDDKDLLASAYAGAALFVLPSWCEGAPLAALEAGLTGVRLVLSDRSSEREYFGSYANYISPDDPYSMREVIHSLLELPETESKINERVNYIRERYSEKIHVNETLKFYNLVYQTRNNEHLVLDVSAYLHSLRSGSFLTGVPLVERNIVDNIIAQRPITRCIAYNDYKKCFVEVEYEDLINFDDYKFNNKYWFVDCPQNVNESTLVFSPAGGHPSVIPESGKNLVYNKSGIFIEKLGRFKYKIKKQRAGKLVIRAAKKFLDTIVMLKGKLNYKNGSGFDQTTIFDSNCISNNFKIKPSFFSHSLNIYGARVVTLGQGWLSNNELLNALLDLSCNNALEAYVYDISYITGAHFSGWDDNHTRKIRFEKLLSRCGTLYTESSIVSNELNKFARSRGFKPNIFTTHLRGKNVTANYQNNKSNTSDYIIYVSTFNKRKNHDFIVNVWRDIYATENFISTNHIKLLFVGEVQEEKKYADNNLIAELNCINIKILTDVSDAGLDDLYRNCIFTIYPSLQEGWGLPVQESLAHGKVCIVSNTVPSAIEISNSGLVKIDPSDFFGWREALLSWASNSKMLEAFEKMTNEYIPPTWKQIADCVLNKKNIQF